jgi:leucyl aminopeptidase
MEIKPASSNLARLRADAIIVGHFERVRHPEGATADVDKALEGTITRLIRQGDIKGKLNELTLLHSPGKLPAGRVLVVGLGKKRELTLNRVRQAVADACRYLRGRNVETIATMVLGAGVRRIGMEAAARAITEGALLGLYTFRRHITQHENDFGEVKELRISGRGRAALARGIERGEILARAANRARDMVNEPANFMTPTDIAEAARQLAEEFGLGIEIFDRDKMEELGMGGLLGVSRGSQQPPKFIILTYKGSDSAVVDLALVGKGITFDSGGIDIKPQEGMHEMKGDMAGGAVVMAALTALARLKPRINVTALVPATENLPSGTAMKPGDIISAMNGKTIEVLNTDAEGRLVMADALSYAKRLGAKAIVDVATLTGACHVALGDVCTGAFTNNQVMLDKLFAVGQETGEFVWQLPMYDEYKEQLKSDIADIKNIGNRYGGAITAAKFLSEFIDGTPWIHLDIAGTYYTTKEKGYLVKGGTGVPVRTLLEYILGTVKE